MLQSYQDDGTMASVCLTVFFFSFQETTMWPLVFSPLFSSVMHRMFSLSFWLTVDRVCICTAGQVKYSLKIGVCKANLNFISQRNNQLSKKKNCSCVIQLVVLCSVLDAWHQRSTSVSRVGAQLLTEQHHRIYLRVAFNFWKEYKEDSHKLQTILWNSKNLICHPPFYRWRNWDLQRLNSFSRVTIIPGGQRPYLVHSWSTLYLWAYICTSSHGNGVRGGVDGALPLPTPTHPIGFWNWNLNPV